MAESLAMNDERVACEIIHRHPLSTPGLSLRESSVDIRILELVLPHAKGVVQFLCTDNKRRLLLLCVFAQIIDLCLKGAGNFNLILRGVDAPAKVV